MEDKSTLDGDSCQTTAQGEKSRQIISNQDQLSGERVDRRETGHEERQSVTGFKLAIIMISMTMVFFLVMLDLSIIATVSHASLCWLICLWL